MELLLPLILLLPLVLLIMRQRRQQREFLSQQDRVAVGQRVMTTAGLFGTVVELDSDTMLLEIAPGVQVRWAKSALGRIITDPAAVGEPSATQSGSVVDVTGQAPDTSATPDLTKRPDPSS